MNLVNKKLAADLAKSVEKSLNEFIEIEVNKRVEAITKSNNVWGNFSRWLDEKLGDELKEADQIMEHWKKRGMPLAQLETEGMKRGFLIIKDAVEDWKKYELDEDES
jgi:hypothetical protein